jgi:transmembrane sensor
MNSDIETVAADWLARNYAGLSAAEAADFQRWLAADAKHAAIYAELAATWRALDRLRLPPGQRGVPDPAALAGRAAPISGRWWMPVLAAAAAAAMLLVWFHDREADHRLPPEQTRRILADAVVTRVGELRKLELPDGSTVRLNTDSSIEIAFSAGERRVRLNRGEAHFAVAKNPAWPFYVEAGGIAVRAVGTAFNVRLRTAGVEVLVTEGKVQVGDPVRATSPAKPEFPGAAPDLPLLNAGERMLIPVAGSSAEPVTPVAPVTVPAAEIARALAWQDQRIDVVAVPLTELVAEFNRYNGQKLVVEDATLGERRFGGSFRIDAPETFARLLESRFGLRVERRGEVIVISR